MTKQFCDRCGVEVTDVPSASISGIEDADENGGGTITDSYDIVCLPCYAAWKAFMGDPAVAAEPLPDTPAPAVPRAADTEQH